MLHRTSTVNGFLALQFAEIELFEALQSHGGSEHTRLLTLRDICRIGWSNIHLTTECILMGYSSVLQLLGHFLLREDLLQLH